MSSDSPKIFVYGSLRLGFHNPAYSYISKYFNLLGEGIVKGRFYFNGSIPVAVSSMEDHFITGELYELKDASDLDWVMTQLDDYEGLNVEAGERPLYKREMVTVLHNVQPAQAYIYWYNGSVENMTELDAAQVSQYLQDQIKP